MSSHHTSGALILANVGAAVNAASDLTSSDVAMFISIGMAAITLLERAVQFVRDVRKGGGRRGDSKKKEE